MPVIALYNLKGGVGKTAAAVNLAALAASEGRASLIWDLDPQAAAELARPICACDSANKELYRWQFDLATATSEAEQYQLDLTDLANPIGTRRGHVAAWKQIARSEVVQGFIPG